ncbi:MAG: hypothetical protein K5761_08735 [Clostridiales bacterium]|nr:hypothetical protein [Clostridiales bacterium]
MNKKIDLSSLKGNDSIVVAVLMVILMIILCLAGWFTIQRASNVQTEVDGSIEKFNQNIALLTNLRTLRDNSSYYEAQKAKYDEVIAENGSYSAKEYSMDLDDLCRKYDLEIQEWEVGEMSPSASVNSAKTTITVVGKESNVEKLCTYIVTQKEIARIDDYSIVANDDGTVIAMLTIVNFTK